LDYSFRSPVDKKKKKKDTNLRRHHRRRFEIDALKKDRESAFGEAREEGKKRVLCISGFKKKKRTWRKYSRRTRREEGGRLKKCASKLSSDWTRPEEGKHELSSLFERKCAVSPNS